MGPFISSKNPMGILDATLQGNLWANPGHIVIFWFHYVPNWINPYVDIYLNHPKKTS
jgi:hypothetical protein